MNLALLAPQPAELSLECPVMVVVVDTEEEFDWSKPFDRRSTQSYSIPSQDAAHAIFDRYGVIPTYVMDYPVATNPASVRYLRSLVDAGRAHVGTHCHPWVTPPYTEVVSPSNSYHGNLPPELEEAKIRASTDAVAQAFGLRPTIFKAGRYGLGPNTFHILESLDYSVDCSFVPHTDFGASHGPSYHRTPDQPFFVGPHGRILEVPLSAGVSGALNSWGRRYPSVFDHPVSRKAHLPGVLSRLGLLERGRLSPEGFDIAVQKRLLRAMLDQGVSVFTLTYHSPSLQPGHTPYVRTAHDLQQFLDNIAGLLAFFKDEMGGAFSTLTAIDQRARAIRDQRNLNLQKA